MQTVLVTGAAGFIGYHLSKRLLEEGQQVVGVDNLNPYYSVQLKQDRLQQLQAHPSFTFYPVDLADGRKVDEIFRVHAPDVVVNLAAQAGVHPGRVQTSWG